MKIADLKTTLDRSKIAWVEKSAFNPWEKSKGDSFIGVVIEQPKHDGKRNFFAIVYQYPSGRAQRLLLAKLKAIEPPESIDPMFLKKLEDAA